MLTHIETFPACVGNQKIASQIFIKTDLFGRFAREIRQSLRVMRISSSAQHFFA